MIAAPFPSPRGVELHKPSEVAAMIAIILLRVSVPSRG